MLSRAKSSKILLWASAVQHKGRGGQDSAGEAKKSLLSVTKVLPV